MTTGNSVRVPKDVTRAMYEATLEIQTYVAFDRFQRDWQRMLAAAPAPAGGDPLSQWGESRRFSNDTSHIHAVPWVNGPPWAKAAPHHEIGDVFVIHAEGPDCNDLILEANQFIGKTYNSWISP